MHKYLLSLTITLVSLFLFKEGNTSSHDNSTHGKLKPVVLTKLGGPFLKEVNQMKTARAAIIENAAILGKEHDIKTQLEDSQKHMHEAITHYDKLNDVVGHLRGEIKQVKGFQHFNPRLHEKDAQDLYLMALVRTLPREKPNLLNKNLQDQVHNASELLKLASEHLYKARADLIKINAELLEKTQ